MTIDTCNLELPMRAQVTWRINQLMRTKLKNNFTLWFRGRYELTTDESEYLEDLWQMECDDAVAQGRLKALKQVAYTEELPASVSTPKASTAEHFVTISKVKDLSLLVKQMDKWSKQKYIKNIEYVYEQTGDTFENAGKSPHVHAVVTSDILRRDAFRDRMWNTFKDVVADKAGVDTLPAHKNSREYLRGKKKDEKMAKVLTDVYWRGKNNLKEIYIIKDGISQEEAVNTETNSTQQETQDDAQASCDDIL